MDQHPVPQNITSYQFRLVGDMTLKQFSELAAGILLAILTSKTTVIPFFIKWPLVGLFTFSGIALAFLPIEERPLDQWLVNFLKAIYSPTQYLWHKTAAIPDFLAFKKSKTSQEKITPLGPKDKKQLRAFMQTLSPQQSLSSIDEQENKAIAYINGLFGPTPSPDTSAPPSTISHQPAGLTQRKLKPKRAIIKEEVIFKQNFTKKTVPPQSFPPPPSSPLKTDTLSESAVRVEPAQPLTPPLQITSLYPPKPPKKPKPRKKRVGPQFSSDLPMPIPPDLPNLLIGMVVGSDDHLIPNAILEIRDLQGNPVRALKTNKLGQFFIATSLPNGEYEIEIDHPGYQFDIIKLQARGKIIPPLKIKAVKEVKQEGESRNPSSVIRNT